jgi:hypothetical protein
MSDEELATYIMRLCGAANEHARIVGIIAAVRAEEREACAKVAEDLPYRRERLDAAKDVAAAIRARK